MMPSGTATRTDSASPNSVNSAEAGSRETRSFNTGWPVVSSMCCSAPPPCQEFSTAGFRSKKTHTGYRIEDDERNHLWEWMVAAARKYNP